VRLLKNFLFLSGAEFISKLVSFAAFAYLARTFGPDGYGFIEFGGAALMCAGLIVDQGFGQYGAREIARNPLDTVALTAEVIAARSFLSLGAYGGIAAVALLTDRPPVVTQLLLVYGLSLFVMPFLLQWVFQGHERMGTAAAVQLVRQGVFAAAVFLLVRGALHIWLVPLAEMAGVCAAAVYCLWMYRRRFGNPFPTRLHLSRRLLREGIPIGLSQMFWVVKMFGATVILGLVATADDLGYFAAAMRIMIALHTFVWLYYFNLLPSLSRAWQQGNRQFAALIGRSLHSVAWIGAGATILWVITAPAAVSAMYGAEFSAAGTPLQWLAGMCLMAAINGHYRFALIASGKQAVEMVTAVLGAVAAAALIPVGYASGGLKGAAIGLCAAEFIVWVSAWWYSRRKLPIGNHGSLLIRPLLGAATVSGMLWLLPVSSPVARAVLAGGVITALAIALDVAVRDQFRKLLRRRRPSLIVKSMPEVTR
jgi:O-antigen/teichoic acid export membrane protein